MSEKIYEQSFPTIGKASLRISNIRGQVNVYPQPADQIIVKAVVEEGSGSAERTTVEMRQETGGRVVVETRFDRPTLSFFDLSQPCKVYYEIQVPAGVELDISTISAGQDLKNLQGAIHTSAISGDIHIDSISGPLRLSTISGRVEGLGLICEKLHLSTVSGDVRLTQSQCNQIEASTVSGQIDLDMPMGGGPYSFRSVSGDVHWQLPAAAGCVVEMHAVSGDLLVSMPAVSQGAARHKTWKVLEGGALVRMNSVSGDFYLQAPPVVVEAVPAGVLSRKEILDKVESGEMTAEQAMAALRGE